MAGTSRIAPLLLLTSLSIQFCAQLGFDRANAEAEIQPEAKNQAIVDKQADLVNTEPADLNFKPRKPPGPPPYDINCEEKYLSPPARQTDDKPKDAALSDNKEKPVVDSKAQPPTNEKQAENSNSHSDSKENAANNAVIAPVSKAEEKDAVPVSGITNEQSSPQGQSISVEAKTAKKWNPPQRCELVPIPQAKVTCELVDRGESTLNPTEANASLAKSEKLLFNKVFDKLPLEERIYNLEMHVFGMGKLGEHNARIRVIEEALTGEPAKNIGVPTQYAKENTANSSEIPREDLEQLQTLEKRFYEKEDFSLQASDARLLRLEELIFVHGKTGDFHSRLLALQDAIKDRDEQAKKYWEHASSSMNTSKLTRDQDILGQVAASKNTKMPSKSNAAVQANLIGTYTWIGTKTARGLKTYGAVRYTTQPAPTSQTNPAQRYPSAQDYLLSETQIPASAMPPVDPRIDYAVPPAYTNQIRNTISQPAYTNPAAYTNGIRNTIPPPAAATPAGKSADPTPSARDIQLWR